VAPMVFFTLLGETPPQAPPAPAADSGLIDRDSPPD
jgi:hypothetical protein